MSTHAPGPWAIIPQMSPEGDVATVYGTTEGWVSIHAPGWSNIGDRKVAMANARLIAAAPDLLEALKAMEDRFGCRSSRQEDQPKTYGCHHMTETCTQCEGLVTGWKAVQAARAAINKARGETKS